VPSNPSVMKLYGQLQKQRAQLAAQGGNVPKGHPSFFGRILDLISRPNYAVASAYGNVVNKINENKAAGKGGNVAQLPGLLSGGAWTGLEGKTKTRFSDVLAAGGVKNPIVRSLGGLGADIATDPTTYLGLGVTKAVPGVEASSEAGHAIQGAKALKGMKIPNLLTEGTMASEAAKAAAPGKVSLELLGRPVASSTRAYDLLAQPARALNATQTGNALNQTFRTAATFPGRLKSMAMVPQAFGIAEANRVNKEILSNFGKLTGPEGVLASQEINAGTNLLGKTSKHGVDMGKLQTEFDRAMHETVNQLRSAGIAAPDHVPGHIPIFYPNAAEARTPKGIAFAREAAKGSPPTLAEVKAAGLHPMENILDAWRMQMLQTQRQIARSTFKNDALDAMGQVFKGTGANNAGKAVEGLGFETLPQKYLRNTRYAGQTVHVPKEVGQAIREIDRLYDSSQAARQLTRTFDGMQRLWKTSVTTINPSHHMRNVLGDMFNNWLDGVTTPGAYSRGMRVALEKPGDMKFGDLRKTTSEVLNKYVEHGGKSGFANTELIGASDPSRLFGQATAKINRGQEKMRNLIAIREDWMRLSHYTEAMRNYAVEHGIHNEADFDKASQHAIERVKKFNFDYSDLTPAETKIRRVVPFYTFMRKNIPLQFEMLALHPGQMSKVPKGFNALQTLLGTDQQHLPMTDIVPSYLKDLASVRLQGEGQNNIFGKILGTKDAVFGDVPIPLEDVGRQFAGSPSDIIRRMIGQTSPPIRMAAELGFKKSTLSGQPTPPLGQYLQNQIPWIRLATSLASPNRPNRVIMPGEHFQSPWAEIINQATGAGIKDITAQAQLSELRRQQDPVQARLRSLRTKRINRALHTGGR
jgi:hypothetical protein